MAECRPWYQAAFLFQHSIDPNSNRSDQRKMMNADPQNLARWQVPVCCYCLGVAAVVAASIGCRRTEVPGNTVPARPQKKSFAQPSQQDQGISPASMPSAADQARFEALIATAPKLTIEVVELGKFKINGNGPFTAEEARAAAVKFAVGKNQILVELISSRKTSSDLEYKTIKKSLHSDGGMLVGLDIAGLGEKRQP